MKNNPKKLKKKLAHYKQLFVFNQATIKEQFKLIHVLYKKQNDLENKLEGDYYYELQNQIAEIRNRAINKEEPPFDNPSADERRKKSTMSPF